MLIIDQKTFKALRPPAHNIKSVVWLCCWWLMLLWADKKDIYSIFNLFWKHGATCALYLLSYHFSYYPWDPLIHLFLLLFLNVMFLSMFIVRPTSIFVLDLIQCFWHELITSPWRAIAYLYPLLDFKVACWHVWYFSLIKEISRLPSNLVVMGTDVTWPKVRQTLDERGLALWRASVPLSIHLTWLPRKQGCETGSWDEM